MIRVDVGSMITGSTYLHTKRVIIYETGNYKSREANYGGREHSLVSGMLSQIS